MTLDRDDMTKQFQGTFLEEAKGLLDVIEENLLSLDKTVDRASSLAAIFRAIHSVKGSGASVGFSALAAFAHVAEDCLAVLRTDERLCSPQTTTLLLSALDIMKVWIVGLEGNSETFTDPEGATSVKESLKEHTIALQQGLQPNPAVGNKPIIGGRAESATNLQRREAFKSTPQDARQTNTNVHKDVHSQSSKNQSIKVDAGRLDTVLDLVGELVVIKSQLSQGLDSGDPILAMLDKTVRELYERTLAMRMMSVKSLFVRLERVAREAIAKLNKDVEFVTSGEETEVDRALVEQLVDPMVHLCRNALDHGIESQEQRKTSGKALKAKLSVSARHSGKSVLIEVRDDGRGIDRRRVAQKAAERGLITAADAEGGMTDAEIYNLLFLPGFSTASTVTDMSGRGVGLDVVRSNILALKGQVEVTSELGVGSVFRIILPLTTAIADGVIFTVSGMRYVMPIEAIHEVFPMAGIRKTAIQLRGDVVELRGEYIPVVSAARVFGRHQGSETLAMVIKLHEKKIAFLVDEVNEQSQVVLKGLDLGEGASRSIAGATILGDGKVALVVNPMGLASA